MKHIVLVGLNFYPRRHSGDKNFWIELLPYLSGSLDKITILSVRNESVPVEKLQIDNCNIEVKYIPPRILKIGESGSKILFRKKNRFPGLLGVVEKVLNSRRILKELKKIYQEEPYAHIHIMDNMGFTNRIIAGKAPSAVSVSAMAYQGRRERIYHKYLLLSYKHRNITVVPYSYSFAKKLQQIGIAKDKIKHIRWGVKVKKEDGYKYKERYKKKIGLDTDKPLFLWAGYIQQIGPKDFILAYDSAKKALKDGLPATFFFAFKREEKAKEFRNLNNAKQGIIVRATKVEEFALLRKAADVFYSPVYNKKVILAPPLTWIEALNEGSPIVTTDVPGADEIVDNGKTGYIAENHKGIDKEIFRISKCYKEMIDSCMRKVKNECNIEESADKYLKLWGI